MTFPRPFARNRRLLPLFFGVGTLAVWSLCEDTAGAQTASTSVFLDNLLSYATHQVFEHNPAQAAVNGGYGFKLLYTGGQWTQGPPSEPTYVDDNWALGMNIGPNIGVRADTAKQYVALHWESKFYNGPTDPPSPLSEFYLHVVDTAGQVHRPIGWTGRHDGSYGDISLAADVIAFRDHTSRPKMGFRLKAGALDVYDGVKFIHHTNNVPTALQLRADGAASYALPYIDKNDNIAFSRPVSGANGAALQAISTGGNSTVFHGSSPQGTSANIVFSSGTSTATKTGAMGIDSAGNLVVRQTSTGGGMYYDYNTQVSWRDKSQNAYASRMVLTKEGKLGVGTSTPTHALDVAGPVRAGTASKPTGITLHDTANGTPHCLQITNGAIVSKPGECR